MKIIPSMIAMICILVFALSAIANRNAALEEVRISCLKKCPIEFSGHLEHLDICFKICDDL